jgi:CheY-like chemotaxis protein
VNAAGGTVNVALVFADHSVSILVVDDDAEVRAVTADLLSEAGYRSLEACDGTEALDMLRSGVRPLAMVIDLCMPGMDGEQLCGVCASDPRFATIPRILVSGHRDGKPRSKNCQVVEFLEKPIDWHRLCRALDRINNRFDR